MGIRNSSTFLALESSQSAMANPSLGFAAFRNFLPMNLSVLDANPSPLALNPYASHHFPTSHVSGRAQTVPSYWFGAPVVSSLTILSSLTDQGLFSNPMHPILLRSSSKYARVVYRDVMTASRRHDTTGRDGPLSHDTIGSA